jgi:AcrR family transcriptional regulator
MSILRAAAPDHYFRERVDLALADVVHRALFGVLPGVNVHPPASTAGPPTLRLSTDATVTFRRASALEADAAHPGKRALRSMLSVANDLIAERGYRGLRIEDIVRAAEVSRGSFYAYFDDIEDFICVVGVRAIQDAAVVVDDLPEHPTPATLRRWIRRYADATLTSGPLVRVWIEAIEGPLRGARAAVIDWGRRRFATMLRRRPLGDVEVDAEILLALVEVFGSRPRPKADLDAVVRLIERGFLAPERLGTEAA